MRPYRQLYIHTLYHTHTYKHTHAHIPGGLTSLSQAWSSQRLCLFPAKFSLPRSPIYAYRSATLRAFICECVCVCMCENMWLMKKISSRCYVALEVCVYVHACINTHTHTHGAPSKCYLHTWSRRCQWFIKPPTYTLPYKDTCMYARMHLQGFEHHAVEYQSPPPIYAQARICTVIHTCIHTNVYACTGRGIPCCGVSISERGQVPGGIAGWPRLISRDGDISQLACIVVTPPGAPPRLLPHIRHRRAR
jgi:hypothetical protein